MTTPLPNQLFINNQWVSPANAERLENINPADESVIGEVICAGEDEVNAAVAGARRAFVGEWGKTTPWDRGRVLHKISQLVSEQIDTLADIEMRETGKPIDAARGSVISTARYFEFYAGVADKIQGTSIPLGEGYLDFTLREPLGVTAHILPWNVPLNMLARGVAPALAAGCTAVVKPAEQTPHGALRLAEIFLQAGLPAGVINIINGLGEKVGAALAAHPGIDGLTFTGSVATGRTVMRACAEHIKPVVLELGGKSPILVFDDASADVAATEAAKGIYSNTGQYCDAGSRLLINRRIHDAVVDKLITKSNAIKVGMPTDNPDMGPLISAEQHDRVMGYISRGSNDGASLLCGGERPSDLDKGYFVRPTVFSQVSADAAIAQEEIFGPVLSVISFDDEEEALAIANGTEFGLAAGVFTRDIDRALRLAQRLDAGTVYVNEYFIGEMASPFGGVKKSGIGRERGLETLANYTRVKNVVIRVQG
ncbi:MAG: aldehyde dehydrogenase family protein [Proteobacteria bacterium]|nr:aldehyde dehydrogenase family protein [Pseudomonadota bacterium]